MGRARCCWLAVLVAWGTVQIGCVGGSGSSVGGDPPLANHSSSKPFANWLPGNQTHPATGPVGPSAELPGRAGSGPVMPPHTSSNPSTAQRLTRAIVHNPVTEAVGTAANRGASLLRRSTARFTSVPVQPATDPLSLSHESRPPGAKLHISLARMSEKAGKAEQAGALYEKALQTEPTSLDAMLAYARFLDRQGRLDEAIEHYRQATAKHPDSPTAQNDLGLCYARGHRLEESVEALTRAVTLSPDGKLYRNNLAKVLVELGRTDEALAQLTSAHGESVAHHNLGLMLHQRGQDSLATDHFAAALRIDPQLAGSRTWLARLSQQVAPVAQAAPQPATVVAETGLPASSRPQVPPVPGQVPSRPAYPQSWQSQAAGDVPVHLPALRAPQQTVLPPTPDDVDRYPTSAVPASPYAF